MDWLKITQQYSFIICNKCITLTQDVNRRNCAEGERILELSILSALCKVDTALKIKPY